MKWKFYLLALLLFNRSLASDIRVEPASWWIGMANPELQLLIHAPNVSETTPELSYPGVTVLRITQVENKNYLFIDLRINKQLAMPGKFTIRFTKNKKAVYSYEYELQQRNPGSAARQSFTGSDVMYLITPDRFSNGDPSNDQVAPLSEGVNRNNEDGRHGGDIQGIINHLDYISDMGYTALWLTPALENRQPNYSYHGYAITDFYNVDARLGSNKKYKELSEQASRKGIKLIMDMVFNHCGSGHWWMNDLPSRDWLNFTDSAVYTNHRKTVFQDPHVAPSDYTKMVDGWFSKTMPDLNQRNPLMATYLIQNSIWWIEYAGLSGIRVDTYPYPDMHFMTEWTRRINEEYPHFNTVGEEWSENPALVSYWQKGKVNKNGYVSYLPSLMDFPVQDALIKSLTIEEKYNDGGFITLYETLANDFQYPDPDNLVVFADNHDIHRFYSMMNKDLNLFKLGMAFVLTSRGIPQVLYGTEVLMTGESHGTIRSDFPGGWSGDNVNAFNPQGLTAQQSEAQAFMKKILNWRKTSPVTINSKLIHYKPVKDVYVYFRYNERGKVMVILNKNKSSQRILLRNYADMIGTAVAGKEILSGNRIQLQGELDVPALSPLIIEF